MINSLFTRAHMIAWFQQSLLQPHLSLRAGNESIEATHILYVLYRGLPRHKGAGASKAGSTRGKHSEIQASRFCAGLP